MVWKVKRAERKKADRKLWFFVREEVMIFS